MKKILFTIFFCIFSIYTILGTNPITLGADQIDKYLPLLTNKKVALVVNHTSCLSDGTHLLDTLLARKVNVTKVMAPEHGFRGDKDAGETIKNGKDSKTGVPLISIYGRNKKPTPQMLTNVDVVIFDIQDVGARFYTYISTMHYVMEACGENNKMCIVLDRPNPHDFIDGPILNLRYRSFVGMHPIPVLHGLTVGELAQMINGESWLKNKIKCDLKVIPIEGWKHGQAYSLPIKPSPNLPNDQAIKLYASLCFFEATDVSIGRGTDFPFQVVGFPDPKFGTFKFTPQSRPEAQLAPQRGKTCYGIDLRNTPFDKGLTLQYLIDFYKKSGLGTSFFSLPAHMNVLSGTTLLKTQIVNGTSEDEIRETWQKGLSDYKLKRKKYLLYEDKPNN